MALEKEKHIDPVIRAFWTAIAVGLFHATAFSMFAWHKNISVEYCLMIFTLTFVFFLFALTPNDGSPDSDHDFGD